MRGERIDRPYSLACEWVSASVRVRPALTPGRANDFQRIARLEIAWGTRLDALGACYGMVKWVAGAAGRAYALERERRYRAVVKLLEDSTPEERWRRFDELRRVSPRLGKRWAQ